MTITNRRDGKAGTGERRCRWVENDKKIRILNIYIMGQVKMSHVYQLTTLLSKTKIKTNKGRKQ